MGTPEFAVPSLEILVHSSISGHRCGHPAGQAEREGQAMDASTREDVRRTTSSDHLTAGAGERSGIYGCIQKIGSGSGCRGSLRTASAQGNSRPSPLGCINVHPSLLPKYRGAAPLNWTIIQGETRSGVTIMRMDEGMDSGDILVQEETPVGPDETVGELHDRLAKMGAELLLKTIQMIEDGTVRRTRQDQAAVTFAPRLKKEDGIIHWHRGVDDIIRLVRGLSPSPCAFTFLQGRTLKIFLAAGRKLPVDQVPGRISEVTQEGLPVAAGDGLVFLREVQAGRQEANAGPGFSEGISSPAGRTAGLKRY